MYRFLASKSALGAFAVSMSISAPVHAADLSPAHWPSGVRAELEQRELTIATSTEQAIRGRTALVSSTLSPVAVHAGMETLRQGGTAADAAATVALTQITTNLGSVVSYAGISQLLYYDAASKKVYALDAGWGSYQFETDPGSIPVDTGEIFSAQMSSELGRSTLVPGFMAGIEAMHKRFGRLPFKDLFQPAIWYAQNGVSVSPLLNAYFRLRQSQLWRTPEGHRFASRDDGLLPGTGDRFVQTKLADTLKEIAARGASYMYTGDWGHRYVAAIRTEGGKITLGDMARYKPVWRSPLGIQLATATVFGPEESDNKNCPTLETLSLLNALHVEKQGSYWRDPSTFTTYTSALRFALYGRYLPQTRAFERSHGFPDTCKARISSRYAASVAPHLTQLLKGLPATSLDAGSHSAAVVVIDRWGNVAALVHSINAVVWGTTGIVVGGVPIPDAASINKARLVRIQPGDHVANDMEPLIALQRGKPILAIATVGASLVPENTRVVAGLLLNGLKLSSLISAPPLLLNTSSPKFGQRITEMPEWIPAGTYDAKVLRALNAEGVQTEEESPEKTSVLRGTAAVGIIDSSNGERRTVEVPGVMGAAEAQ